MSEKKPTPLIEGPPKKRCPVCGEISYSAAGIHPQCSVKKEDEQRTKLLKEKRSSEADQEPKAGAKEPTQWQKKCPKCAAVVHVRKTQCVCGRKFGVSQRQTKANGDSS